MGADLLGRDAFRAAVLGRDGGLCVRCGAPGQDAHHLMERRLFTGPGEAGGYFLDNGVTLCGRCHLEAESTALSVEDLRDLAGVTRVVLPEHLYDDQPYTKWGDPILANGTRMRGELFDDESVQKAIKPYLDLYTNRVKYPRTYHLFWSEGVTDDDRVMADLSGLAGAEEVVVTEKLDGENTTMYRDGLHARSLDDLGRLPYRDWVKNLWGGIAHEIPDGWRLCGENLYAVHSIRYEGLSSYFSGFSVWDERNVCLSWDDTAEVLGVLGLEHVPVLYRGPFDPERVHRAAWGPEEWGRKEGYVVRDAGAFHYRDFRRRVGKFVRRDHVGTAPHWMRGRRWEKNGIERAPSS